MAHSPTLQTHVIHSVRVSKRRQTSDTPEACQRQFPLIDLLTENIYTTIFVKFIDMHTIRLFYAPAQIEKRACAIWNFQPKIKVGQVSFQEQAWAIAAPFRPPCCVRPRHPKKN
ncbi:hypothetical protein [Rhizobium sp. NFACC06-2]|uniref:hypothetical protein n=1 Tax=Rhizobium sp. NFACC06-2 TaxID=1566264 RepID=UPI00165FC784|nr:hypothetical protein [Rhizobium sp. NFACC06-2]